ncbi:sulfotransferase family protein [Abyssalbus ytuae]|uniref:Sulfotransferase n=1 Tax=Abyssalbus ytuae TaxID=2926907 RepID=A0A9E6ZVL2_9FLAO|nr:sulfotransferase [Abyssalbus ytuae]UOB16042.1 sulfotransferase [Abyssalbus ytuae]
MKTIQIIGTQRSGSNLLRVMLNQIQEIDAPHPPHILQRFFPLLPKYGDLNVVENFENLLDDVCKLVELNPVPWEGVSFNRNELRVKCKSNSLIEIFKVIYQQKAQSSNASYWCCKSMSNIHYVNAIEEEGIKPMYIHLYRDGRDVALSFKKAIVGHKHIYHIAKQWQKDQEACLKLKKRLGADRVFQISYEELLKDSEGSLKRLCAFLKVPFSQKMLTFYNSKESSLTAKSGKMWKNLNRPVMKNNHDKFIKELSQEEIIIFEQVAGGTLSTLGYNLVVPEPLKKHVFTKEEIEKFDIENNALKEQAIQNASGEDLEKRKEQKNFLKDLKMQYLSQNRHYS